MNTDKNIEVLTKKIDKGLQLAYERMIAEKRKNKQPIIIMKNGQITRVYP